MRRAAPAKISEITSNGAITARGQSKSAARLSSTIESVRVSPSIYLAALFFFSLTSAFLSFLELPTIALLLLCVSWLTFPPLAWFDRITFDGETLRRTGLLPRMLGRIFRQPLRLKIAEIEQIETQAIRALKSGGRVFYRYRSEVRGQGLNFVFASGGKSFRRMVRKLFPLVLEDKLDSRSLELRDYLNEPEKTKQLIKTLQLPSAEVAENAIKRTRQPEKLRQIKRDEWRDETRREEAARQVWQLRQAANELRLTGNLPQSLEAFRRALFIAPADGWLLLEFARGLHSYAGASRQIKLMRRAFAALRLAAKCGSDNARLLVRIGESFSQFGENKSAERTFRRVLELDGENFRAYCGLAEASLNEGKLAHVTHHYQAAVRTAADEAVKNWARGEADYFTLLNNDEDYMDAELMRINWLHNAKRGAGICLRLTIFGLIVTLFGSFTDEQITQLGMAVVAGTTSLWLILNLAVKFLQHRCEPLEDDEED